MNKTIFKEKHIDELIELRKEARLNKDYKLSDEIRDYLDNKLVFIFDQPDKTQKVLFLSEIYFKGMGKEFKNKRKYVEYRESKEKTDEEFESWLYSQFKSSKWNDEHIKEILTKMKLSDKNEREIILNTLSRSILYQIFDTKQY